MATWHVKYTFKSMSGQVYFWTFNFQNEVIDDAIYSYDHGAMELHIFWKRFHLDPDLVSRATKIPRREGEMLNSWKTRKLEKIEMASKICGKQVVVPRNGLKMEDVPQGIYKTLIHIILRTIMNHHKRHDILGDCMKLAIHQVKDMAIDVPHLLARKLHFAFQDSQMKRVNFSYPGTLQKIIDLCRPSVVGSISITTYIRKHK